MSDQNNEKRKRLNISKKPRNVEKDDVKSTPKVKGSAADKDKKMTEHEKWKLRKVPKEKELDWDSKILAPYKSLNLEPKKPTPPLSPKLPDPKMMPQTKRRRVERMHAAEAAAKAYEEDGELPSSSTPQVDHVPYEEITTKQKKEMSKIVREMRRLLNIGDRVSERVKNLALDMKGQVLQDREMLEVCEIRRCEFCEDRGEFIELLNTLIMQCINMEDSFAESRARYHRICELA